MKKVKYVTIDSVNKCIIDTQNKLKEYDYDIFLSLFVFNNTILKIKDEAKVGRNIYITSDDYIPKRPIRSIYIVYI